MNKAVLADRLYRAWILLPHCQIHRRKHFRNIKRRFHSDTESDISIFCTNCVGGELYYLLGLPFKSPLINTTLDRLQFITLCEHLKEYMSCELKVETDPVRGLIGKLGNEYLPEITIGFPHDTDPKVIKENWKRRLPRINYDKLVLICDDKGGVTEDHMKRFGRIPAYRKILFTKDDRQNVSPVCFKLPGYENLHQTGDYNAKSLKGLWKFCDFWDYVSFLNGEQEKE